MSDTEIIKQKLSIVDIAGSYLKIERSGSSYRACCPFHNEKTPSFFISPDRGNYYCFGCGAKGDIFSLVEHLEVLDFKGALKFLADKAGVTLRGVSDDGVSKDEKEMVYRVLERATVFFEQQLSLSSEASSYIKNRGVNDESIKAFRIGYALTSWQSLGDALQKEGYKKEVLLQAGLVKENEGRMYDRFRDRIMFPITDPSGRVIGFSGRILHDDPQAAKYLNSPETILFKKSELLYGIDKAKDAIRAKGYSVLVEGQLDLILSHQVGITNTVASSGTALSETSDHPQALSYLFRLAPKLAFAFDGDKAGVMATYRGGSIALKTGFDVKVVPITSSDDPADIIAKDPTVWKELLKKTESLILFFTDRAQNETKNQLERGRYITERIVPLIACLSNPLDRDYYIQEISRKTQLEERSIRDLVADYVKNKSLENKTLVYKTETYKKLSPAKELIGSLLLSKDSESLATQQSLQKILGEERYQKLLDDIEEHKEELLFQSEMIQTSIKDKSVYHENLLRDVQKMVVTEELGELKSRISSAEQTGEAVTELMKTFQEKRRLLESLE
jgi:DNA primase